MSGVCFKAVTNHSCSVCTVQFATYLCFRHSSTHYLCTHCASKHVSNAQCELHRITLTPEGGDLRRLGSAAGREVERDETAERLKEGVREVDMCIESLAHTSEQVVALVQGRANDQLRRLREFRSILQRQVSLGTKAPKPVNPVLQALLQNQFLSDLDFSRRRKLVHCRTDFRSWQQQFADLLSSFTVMIEVEVGGAISCDTSSVGESVLIVSQTDIDQSTETTDMSRSFTENTEFGSRESGLCRGCSKDKINGTHYTHDSAQEKQNVIWINESLYSGKDEVLDPETSQHRFPYIPCIGKSLIALLMLAAFGYFVYTPCSCPVPDNSVTPVLYPEGLYEGQRNHKGQRHGFGVQQYVQGGTAYSGLWVNDSWHGLGTLEYSDGRIVEGRWYSNVLHGQGALFAADGAPLYIGEFANGQQSGLGILQLNGEIAFAGQWDNDAPAGSCAAPVDYGLCYALFPQADPILYSFSSSEGRLRPREYRDGLWESIKIRSSRDLRLTGIAIAGSGREASLTLIRMEIVSNDNYAGLLYTHSAAVDLTTADHSVQVVLNSVVEVPSNTPIRVRVLLEGEALCGSYLHPVSQDGLNVVLEDSDTAGAIRGIYYKY